MCGTGSELGLSTVEIFQGSRWREKEAWGRGEQWANPGSEYSEDQRSRLGEEGSEATKRVTNYTNVGGQRVRGLGGVFQYAPVSDVILEELKIA